MFLWPSPTSSRGYPGQSVRIFQNSHVKVLVGTIGPKDAVVVGLGHSSLSIDLRTHTIRLDSLRPAPGPGS